MEIDVSLVKVLVARAVKGRCYLHVIISVLVESSKQVLTPKAFDSADWSSSREKDLSFEGVIPALARAS
jgi:hypothetical protein